MKRLAVFILFFFISLAGYSQLTYKQDYYGNTRVTNKYGVLVATGSKDIYGNYVWKDPYGNMICYQYKDYYGNIITKDPEGNLLSTVEYDQIQTQGNVPQVPGVSVFNVQTFQHVGSIAPTPIIHW